MEGTELAQADANPNLNEEERDVLKGQIRQGALAQREQIDQQDIAAQKNLPRRAPKRRPACGRNRNSARKILRGKFRPSRTK